MKKFVSGSPDAAPSPATEEADTLNEEARFIMKADAKRALLMLSRARRIAEACNYRLGVARSLRNSGECYYLLADYRRGLDDAFEALALFEQLQEGSGMAATLSCIGKTYEFLGEHTKALEFGSRSLQISEAVGDRLEASRALTNLGATYCSINDFHKALDCLHRSLSIKTEINDLERLPRTLSNLGVVYEKLGDYEKAEEYYRQALRGDQEIGDTYSEGICLTNLGILYRLMGNNSAAHEHLLKAAEVSQKDGNKYNEASAFIYLGKLHQVMGGYEQALISYRRGQKIARQIGNKWLMREALIGLGDLFCELGDVARATKSLTASLGLPGDVHSNDQLFRAHQLLSQVYERQGDFSRALEHHKSFFEFRQRVFGEEADRNLMGVMVRAEVERAQSEAEIHRLRHVELAARVAHMSHEIRTPLNAVIGMTGLLLDTEQTPEQLEYSETILLGGKAMLAVIDDVLDLSRVEAGGIDLELRDFDLRECVEGALEILALRAAENGLDLIYEIAEGTPAAFVGDFSRLRQVLINTVGNAVKFTQRGEVFVSVGSSMSGADGYYGLHFAVRDTGIGIPPAKMDRLFVPFSQVDSSDTRRYGGTGLGLAISKGLVEAMGGRIWVESVPGKGSTFHFTIRVEAAPSQPDAERLSAAGERVLIVDDNETQRLVLSRQIASWGFEPVCAASAEEALNRLVGGKAFDLVLLDARMPNASGVELAARIRSLPRGATLRLVIMSELGRREAAATQAGAAGCSVLAKPIRKSQLYETLFGDRVRPHLAGGGHGSRVALDGRLAKRYPLRILVTDDNAINRQVILLTLGRMGYSADAAASGAEALDAVRRRRYDLLLMDCQMPGMDGLEATRLIRSGLGVTEQPRIIAMTASAMKGDRERFLAAGMDDYLAKPVRVEALQAAITKWATPAGATAGREPAVSRAALMPFGDEVEQRACDLTPPPAELDLGDWIKMCETQEGDDGILREVSELFLRDTPARMAAMRSALEGGQWQTLRREAHSLRGSCANFGAARMASLCAEIERRAASGSGGGVNSLWIELAQEYGRVKLLIEGILTGELAPRLGVAPR